MFESMLAEIDSETIRILFSLQISADEVIESLGENKNNTEIVMKKEEASSELNLKNKHNSSIQEQPKTIVRETPKLGRNEICWCDSGKKYKHCHGK